MLCLFLSFSYSQGIIPHMNLAKILYAMNTLWSWKIVEKEKKNIIIIIINGRACECASVEVFVWLIRLFPGNFFPAPSMTPWDNDCGKKQQ